MIFSITSTTGKKDQYSCILFKHRHIWSSRGSLVGRATRLIAANPERVVRSQEVGKKFVFPPTRPDQLCGPPNPPFNSYKRLFPREVTIPGREVDHPPPFSAEINKWSYTSTRQYVRQHFTAIFTVIYSSSTTLSQPAIFKCSRRRELSFSHVLLLDVKFYFTFHRIIIQNVGRVAQSV